MIAPAPRAAGGRPPIPRTPKLARRILRGIAETGSVQIAAGLVGRPRSWVENWAKDDERFGDRLRRAISLYLAPIARGLLVETDAVRAQSLRFILARRCEEFRQEKGPLEVAAEQLVRNVRFVVAEPPKDAASRA